MSRSITFRESLLRNVIALTIVLCTAILLTMAIASRASARLLSRQIIDSSMQRAEAQLRLFFDEVERELELLADWADAGLLEDISEENLRETNRMLQPLLDAGTQMSTLLIADETGHEWMLLRLGDRWRNRITLPTSFGTASTAYEWTQSSPQPMRVESTVPYDPRVRPWFTGSLESLADMPEAMRSEIVWTEPYEFFTTGQLGITASVAVRRADQQARVLAVDVLLSDLDQYTSSLRVSSNGYLFVLGPTGQFIALPHEGLFESRAAMQRALLRSPEEVDVPLIRDALAALGSSVAAAQQQVESGAVRFESAGDNWWGEVIAFPLSSQRSLYVAVLVPEADLQGFMPVLRIIIVAIVALTLIVATFRAFVVAGQYSEPIEQLVQESERLSSGNFNAGPPIDTRVREMRALADAHENMRGSLKSLVKLERDLLLAREIQQATMPRTLPDVVGYDIAAWNQPADETGGDTYDAIGLTDTGDRVVETDVRRALLMLADATGHGIGPALSAMEIRSMLRMAARSNQPLDEIARHLNQQLAADLPEGRFITTWLGLLDARTHQLQCFSAGQGPMLLYRAGAGTCERHDSDAAPFGILHEMHVQLPAPTMLEPGDIYAVLSDGIFEVIDPDGEEFGIGRVCELLPAHAHMSAQKIIEVICSKVAAFSEGARQQDDQTIILIKRQQES